MSTTSHMIGEYDTDDVLLTHAWPDFENTFSHLRFHEGHTSRNAYVLAFKTAPIEIRSGTVMPQHGPTGRAICSILSVLFGKRFDSHGPLESNGSFGVPTLDHFDSFCIPSLPQNSRNPRSNYPVALDMRHVACFGPLFLANQLDGKIKRQYYTACSFYARALQSIENDSDAAYLYLITCGEVIANIVNKDAVALLDDDTKNALAKIESDLEGGKRIANMFKSKLKQVKKRFVRTIVEMLDDDFFANPEADERGFGLNAADIESNIGAAYDVRSKYVHTGEAFGGWIAPRGNGANWEVQMGLPVVDDKDYAKVLAKTPTYIGLERVIRYCLLKVAHQQGLLIYDRDEHGPKAAS